MLFNLEVTSPARGRFSAGCSFLGGDNLASMDKEGTSPVQNLPDDVSSWHFCFWFTYGSNDRRGGRRKAQRSFGYSLAKPTKSRRRSRKRTSEDQISQVQEARR